MQRLEWSKKHERSSRPEPKRPAFPKSPDNKPHVHIITEGVRDASEKGRLVHITNLANINTKAYHLDVLGPARRLNRTVVLHVVKDDRPDHYARQIRLISDAYSLFDILLLESQHDRQHVIAIFANRYSCPINLEEALRKL